MTINYLIQSQSIRLIVASSVLVILLLGIWVNSYTYGCFMLVFPMFFLVVIAHSFIEIKMHERICFKNCYFKSSSFLARVFSSRGLVIVFYTFMSIIMTFYALYGVIEYSQFLWIYLVLHIVFSVMIYKYLTNIFSSMIKGNYKKIFAREWAINIMAAVFIVVFVYTSFYGYEPAYLRNGLSETMTIASHSISSSCEFLNYVLKLQKEIDSVYWWIVHSSSENMENATLKFIMWIIFLLMNSLAILGVNRFIMQIIYLLDKKIFKEK